MTGPPIFVGEDGLHDAEQVAEAIVETLVKNVVDDERVTLHTHEDVRGLLFEHVPLDEVRAMIERGIVAHAQRDRVDATIETMGEVERQAWLFTTSPAVVVETYGNVLARFSDALGAGDDAGRTLAETLEPAPRTPRAHPVGRAVVRVLRRLAEHAAGPGLLWTLALVIHRRDLTRRARRAWHLRHR